MYNTEQVRQRPIPRGLFVCVFVYRIMFHAWSCMFPCVPIEIKDSSSQYLDFTKLGQLYFQ